MLNSHEHCKFKVNDKDANKVIACRVQTLNDSLNDEAKFN